MITEVLPANHTVTVAPASTTTVLVIGPTPPPFNGMSVATSLVLQALAGGVPAVHLDTADHRSLANVGKIDLQNVWLAFKHAVQYLYLLLTRNPQVVYVPIAQESLAFLRDSLFLLPARLLGKKVVIHLHGGYFATFYKSASPAMRHFIRYSIGRSVRAVVLGESLANMFAGVLPANRIRVIPNGIPDSFAEANSRRVRSGRTILFLSTLMKEKGVLDLLGAIPRIAERVPDVQVVFAGEWLRPQEQAEALQMIRDMNLGSRVHFVGPVAPLEKYNVLTDADVFVMPTFYKNEGHPYVLLEAMSAGLPIVSTNAGCIPETVINGQNGFIIKASDQDEMVERVVTLLTDDDCRRRMGQASRRRFLEFYTLERFSKDMQQLFSEISTEHPA